MDAGRIFKIIIGTLAFGLMIFFFLKTEFDRTYNWSAHYRTDSKDPYGCYLFHQILKSGRQNSEFIELNAPLAMSMKELEVEGTTYIYLGEKRFYTTKDIEALLAYVERGNDAYILSEAEPMEVLMGEDFKPMAYDLFNNSVATLTFSDSTINPREVTIEYIKDFESGNFYWPYLDSISDPAIETLGTYSGDPYYVNFIRVKYGKGHLIFHFAPLVFTNFHLKNEDNFNYANQVLKGVRETVYWDEFSHMEHSDSAGPDQNPLGFILSQPALRWAWYILLFTALVYLVFYTKRKQRAIPVIQSINNTSIEFVKTIGGMYFQQEGSNFKILQHQYQLFLTYIRTHYGIQTNKLDDAFLKKVSLKSGIDQNSIDTILKEAIRIRRLGEVTDRDLTNFYNLTTNFYRNCK